LNSNDKDNQVDEVVIQDHTRNNMIGSGVIDDAEIELKNQDSMVDLDKVSETIEEETSNKLNGHHIESIAAGTMNISSDDNFHVNDNGSYPKLNDQSNEFPVNGSDTTENNNFPADTEKGGSHMNRIKSEADRLVENNEGNIDDQESINNIKLDNGKIVQSKKLSWFPGFRATKSFQRRPSLGQSPFYEWCFKTIESNSRSRTVESIFETWKTQLWYENNLSHKHQIRIEVAGIVESGFQKSGATFINR